MRTTFVGILRPFTAKPWFGALGIAVGLNIFKVALLLSFGGHFLGELFLPGRPLFWLSPALLLLDYAVPYAFLAALKRDQAISNRDLYIRINEGIEQVKKTQNISVIGFTKLAEARDPDTGDHIMRIAHYARLLAVHLGKKSKYSKYITPRYVEEIFIAAPLHDIGKVGIKDDILLKEGKLTDREFEIMKMHTIIGGNIISELERKLSFRSFFTLGKEIAYHHHQKYNGRGYPNIFKDGIMLVEEGVGKPLRGEEIPLSARIVALADVYDALVSKRVYKKAFSHETASDIISSERGEHFDPAIVDAFVEINHEFLAIRRQFNK